MSPTGSIPKFLLSCVIRRSSVGGVWLPQRRKGWAKLPLLSLLSLPTMLLAAPGFQSSARALPHCFTPSLLHLFHQRDQDLPVQDQDLDQQRLELLTQHRDARGLALLSPEALADQRLIAGDPLPSEGAIVSSLYPVSVHYRLESQKDYAIQILAWAETAWQQEVVTLGFEPALPDHGQGGDDGLDFYLGTYASSGGGAYTIPSFVDETVGDGRSACSAYIVLYEEITPDKMPAFVAHELNHALQAAMDYRELSWAWEVTATYMEDVVFDSVNDYYHFIPSFQENPDQSLTFFGDGFDIPYYPYGAAIFLHYLSEADEGGSADFAVELWTLSEQERVSGSDGGSDGNEPDLLDAIDTLTADRGGFTSVLADFALWRTRTGTRDDGSHFSEGRAWSDSEVSIQFSISPAELPAHGTFSQLSELGTGYLELKASDEPLPDALDVRLEGDPAHRLGLAFSRHFSDGHSEDLPPVLASAPGPLKASVALEGAQSLTVAALNLGRPDRDADDETQKADVDIWVEESGGCGCTQAGQGRGPGGGIAGILLLVLSRVRGRRQASVRGRSGKGNDTDKAIRTE